MKIRKLTAEQLTKTIREIADKSEASSTASSSEQAVWKFMEAMRDVWSGQYDTELMNPNGEDEEASRDSWTEQVSQAVTDLETEVSEIVEKIAGRLFNGDYGF